MEKTLTFLKQELKRKKIKQKDLAPMLGIGVVTLWRMFKQETDMPLKVYSQICEIIEFEPKLTKSLDLDRLNKAIDDVLEMETEETLNEWIKSKRRGA